ncbi:MAG: glycosyltransferase family 2 protein [Nanoarchaeota archaeon]|nr:glycosyltransferase family 2 protein [DPANN group archaeon]MBL7116563.1 glycosyltransferase family 2 protein [Nanoarchaeota archaeon]
MITTIIPTKNEETTIKGIIKSVKPYSDEIIVIDGHSKDKTRDISLKEKVNVILDNKKGKGAALRIAGKKAKGDILVFIDSDGSHDPKDIPKLVEPIVKNKISLVIASRIKGGSDEFQGDFEKVFRTIASHLITATINWRWKKNLSDTQNGFRSIRKDVFLDIKLKENSFTIEQEMVMKCLKKGYKIIEIPSHEYQRKKGISRIKLWKEGPKYVWCLIKNIL